MRSRRVNARATRTALIVASVPELTKRTRSIDGIERPNASRPAWLRAGSGAPKLVPRFAVAVIALIERRAARGRG